MSAKFEAAQQTLETALDVLKTCGVVYSGHFEVRSSKSNNENEKITIDYFTPKNVWRDTRRIKDTDRMIDIVMELLYSFEHEGYTFGEF